MLKKKKNNIPLISVLIPVLNAEKYLDDAVSSIQNQTLQDFEIIMIDDGSTDSSWEVMQKLSKKDKRVYIYQNKKNLGVSPTRNKLIQLARADFIAWQDADDVSVPYRLQHQYDEFVKNERLGILGGFLQFIDKKGEPITIRKYRPKYTNLLKYVFFFAPLSQGAAMIRKSVYKKVGLYKNELPQAEDLDMTLRIARSYDIANLQEVVLLCRYHEGSISTRKMKECIEATIHVRIEASKLYGYHLTIWDRIVIFAPRIVTYLPKKIVFLLFNIVRGL